MALIALGAADAQAAEVQFEGFYQMRGRLFDTLSLDRTIDDSEGLSWYVQQRLFLRPKFFITEHVGMFADIRALDGVAFGDAPQALIDPVTGDATPLLFSDSLSAPTSETDATAVLSDISLWRAWGEVRTGIGTFKFGRQPLHWGKGIWQNDGLGLNMDFGDTADRISWEHLVSNIWLRIGADVNVEGFVNQTDDTTSFHASAAYRTERMEGGLQFQYRRSGAGEGAFNLFTIDGTFDLEFGPVDIEGEVIGQFGGGDLDNGVNNVQLTSLGAVIDAGLTLDRWRVRLEGGLATGDGDDGDTRFRTFTFDRDYNVGLFMFEQNMPVLAAQVASTDNGGRNSDVVLTGHGVSNALYLRPQVAFQAVRGLWIDFKFLGARVAKVPDQLVAQDRRSYGVEFDLGVQYTGLDHLEFGATFGAFLPGSYYRNYTDDVYSGFRAPAFGGQLLTRVKF